jgi:hypothetical protein
MYPSASLGSFIGLQEYETPRIYRQSAHEGGKVDSPRHRPPLSGENFLGSHLC